MSNLAAIIQEISTSWNGRIVTKPTFQEWETRRDHESSNEMILYKDVHFNKNPIDHKKEWYDYHHEIKLLLRSATKANIQFMRDEIDYVLRNTYYKAPWFPVWDDDETNTLCLLECDEGTGTTLNDSTDNGHDWTFDAVNTPAWVTSGTPFQKSYVELDITEEIDQDAGGDGTLIDNCPDNITIEVVFKTKDALTDTFFIQKRNKDSPIDEYNMQLNDQINAFVKVGGVTVWSDSTLGLIPTAKWTNVMMTHGARGLEWYIDGVLQDQDTSLVTTIGDGTDNDFVINSANGTVYLIFFRVSSVQRLPYDDLYSTTLTQVTQKKGIYEAELTVIGELYNVFLGGT
jgi:hypothetical protein